MVVKYSTLPGAEPLTGEELVAVSQLGEDGILDSRKVTIADIIALAGGGGTGGGLPEIVDVIQGGTVSAEEFNVIANAVFNAAKVQVATFTSYMIVVNISDTQAQTGVGGITVYPTPAGRFIQVFGNGALGPTAQSGTFTAYMPDGGSPSVLSMSLSPAIDSSDVHISERSGNILKFDQGLFVPGSANELVVNSEVQGQDEFLNDFTMSLGPNVPEKDTVTPYSITDTETGSVTKCCIRITPFATGKLVYGYGPGIGGPNLPAWASTSGGIMAVTYWVDPSTGMITLINYDVVPAEDGGGIPISNTPGNLLTKDATGLFVGAGSSTSGAKVTSGNWATNYGDDFTADNAYRKTSTNVIWKTTVTTTVPYNTNYLLAQPVLDKLPADANGIVLPFNLAHTVNVKSGFCTVVLVLIVQGEPTQMFNPLNGLYSPLGIVSNVQYDPWYNLTYWYGPR